MKPVIVMASDHAGFHMKEFVKKQLEDAGYTVEDYGTHSEESVDTAPYAFRVVKRSQPIQKIRRAS